MARSPDEVTALLRGAMGVPKSVTAGAGHLSQARAAEDVALAAWSTAVANYDRTFHARRAAIDRAEAEVRRRMAPLSAARYERMEQTLARVLPRHRSATWVRDMLHVQRTRRAVDEASGKLVALTTDADAGLAVARDARSTATAELIEALGLGCASRITGLSPQRLGGMRAGR